MSSGFIHLTGIIALCMGVTLGAFCAKKFKSWDFWFFALALFTGWFIHVFIFDALIIIFNDMLTKIYLAKFL